jgi:hypothetical protein
MLVKSRGNGHQRGISEKIGRSISIKMIAEAAFKMKNHESSGPLCVHCSFFEPLIRLIRAGWPSILIH